MKSILTGVLYMGLLSLVLGQEVRDINSVEDAIGLAKTNNPELEIYQLQVEQAIIEMKDARLYRLPTISANFSGQNNRSLATTPLPGEIFGQPGEVVDAQFGQPYNYNAGITVSKSLFDVSAKIQSKVADAEHDLQSANGEAYLQHLTYQTSLYYFSLLTINEAVELNHQDVALTDSILLITREKRIKGLISESSYLRAKILANSARENLSTTQAKQEEYQLQLKLLLGLPVSTNLVLNEEMEDMSTYDLNVGLDYDRGLLTSKTEAQLADLRVKQQRTAYLPKLTMESYFGQQQFRDDFGLSFKSEDWSTYSYLGISLSIPVFTGFGNKNKLKSARVAHEMAVKRFESNQTTSAFQDQKLLQNFIGSKDRVGYAQENLKLYEGVTSLSMQKYEEGLISLDEYLSTFEDALKAEQHYLNALNTFFNYYATIVSRQSKS